MGALLKWALILFIALTPQLSSAEALDPLLEQRGKRCDFEHVAYETFAFYLGEGLKQSQVQSDLDRSVKKDKDLTTTDKEQYLESIKKALDRFKGNDPIETLPIEDRRTIVVFECLVRVYREPIK